MTAYIDSETKNLANELFDGPNQVTLSTKAMHSINLAAKVRKLAVEGHLSSFLAHTFLDQQEGGNNFERKGA